MTKLRQIFTSLPTRSVLYLLLCVTAGIMTMSVIDSSRAIAEATPGSASAKENGFEESNIPAPFAASTPPLCGGCEVPMEWREDFDGVMPPALPQWWLATNPQGPPPVWVTSTSGVPDPPADTPPNAASIDDPAVVSDKLLDYCCINIFEACCGQLTFRQNFDLEASADDPNLGFDGAVLEISLDQGQTYQDILDAGGGFISGGYNRTISTDRGSPIAGRRAWSGNSGGFITTVVVLPGIVPGGTLRWRMASDKSGSGEGWRIDTIDVTWCQGGPSCTPTLSPSPTPTATPRVTPRPRMTPFPRPIPASPGYAGMSPKKSFDGPPTPTPRGRRFTPFPRPTPR
jgi:hypothetical protein